MTARPPKRLFHLVFVSHEGRALGAESEEKHEPVSDIDTQVADSLKALDPAGRLEKRTWIGATADICTAGTMLHTITSLATLTIPHPHDDPSLANTLTAAHH